MSIQAMAEVWKHSTASGTSLLVMLALADHASDQGVCFPFVTSLASKTRADEKTVRRCLRALQDSKQIDLWEWYDKRNGRRRNAYRLTVGELAVYRGIEPEDIREKATVMRINVPTSTRRRVFERDHWTCVRCGSKLDLVIDHATPVTEGGGNEDENLQTLCAICNTKKAGGLPPGLESRPDEMSGRDGTKCPVGTGRNVRSEGDEMSGREGGVLSIGNVIENRNKPSTTALAVAVVSMPKAVKIDGRNVPLDTLCDVCGIDPKSPKVRAASTALGDQAKPKIPGIRSLFWIECERAIEANPELAPRLRYLTGVPTAFEQAIADRIRVKADAIAAAFPRLPVTPHVIRDYWLDVELAKTSTGRVTDADIDAAFGDLDDQ